MEEEIKNTETAHSETQQAEAPIVGPYHPLTAWNIFLIMAGSAMYACSVNLFMMPLRLYAGGIVGLAQLIRTLAFPRVTSVDVAGIINLCLNIPLFLLAYRSMSRKMLIGTVISVAVQTVVFTIVKIPAEPLVGDTLPAGSTSSASTSPRRGISPSAS